MVDIMDIPKTVVVIIDDFGNKQYYYAGYFWSIEEGRDFKINSLLD